MRWSVDRWPVVQGRTVGTHKCTGAAGRHVCCASLWKGQTEDSHLPQDDQHISPVLCDQDGGTRSTRLTEVARQMWDWCLFQQMTLSASHPSGLDNQVADQELRQVQTSAEWKLQEKVFNKICAHLGPCTVDLFATRLNHRLDKYVSWRPDPGAMMTNAFHINWVGLERYAFSPSV